MLHWALVDHADLEHEKICFDRPKMIMKYDNDRTLKFNRTAASEVSCMTKSKSNLDKSESGKLMFRDRLCAWSYVPYSGLAAATTLHLAFNEA